MMRMPNLLCHCVYKEYPKLGAELFALEVETSMCGVRLVSVCIVGEKCLL